LKLFFDRKGVNSYNFCFLHYFECANLRLFPINKSLFHFLLNRKTVFCSPIYGNCYICGLIKSLYGKSVSPGKSGLLYGVLFGVIMVLEFVVMYIIGMRSLVGTSAGALLTLPTT
jgi:hypothetical protein